MPNAQNVLVGSATLRVAPIGTTIPVFTASPLAWDAAWKQVGYTKDGTKLDYNPTFTDITVDEEDAPIDKRLTGEKAVISANVAEATLDNIATAIAGVNGAPVVVAAVGGAKGTKTIKVGSGKAAKMMVSLEGVSPDGLSRVVVGYIAIATGNLSLAFKKNSEVIVPMSFELMADSSKPAGERLYEMVDQTIL